MNRRESQDRCRQGAPRPKKQFYAMPGAAFRSAGPGTRTVEHYPQIILRNPERPPKSAPYPFASSPAAQKSQTAPKADRLRTRVWLRPHPLRDSAAIH